MIRPYNEKKSRPGIERLFYVVMESLDFVFRGLFLLLDRKNVDEGALRELTGECEHLLGLEGNRALDERDECVVAGLLHVFPGVELGSALADEDVPRFRYLTAEKLHAEALCP